MPKTKISEFSATAGNNTDIDGINIAEGCPPSGINDAIRELMAQLKDFQAGTAGDSFNGPVGTTTPAAGAFTNFSASGTFALTGDQVQISEGGTGQTTANAAFNALAPSQSTHAGKYLKTDGTNTSWDAIEINTADITGTLPVANGGTGVTSSTGTGSVVLSASPTFTGTVNGAALTLSSSLTLSGGTANGVAYLNGSKVLTTGSALTFNGTNLGLNNDGYLIFASPDATVEEKSRIQWLIEDGSEMNSIRVNRTNAFGESTMGFYTRGGGPSALRYLIGTDGTSIWSVAGSEAMRLTSTGLGIGTSSPARRLSLLVSPGATSDDGLRVSDGTRNAQFVLTGSSYTYRGVPANAAMVYNNGSIALLADGAGATTSFHVAGIGEIARFDSSGSLGIGTSSPAGKLTVFNNVTGSPPVQYLIGDDFIGDIRFARQATIASFPNSYAMIRGLYGSGDARRTILTFWTSDTGSSTEQMRLDSSGNLGLGVTPSAFTANTKALQIKNAALWNDDYAAKTSIGYNAYQDTDTTYRYIASSIPAGRYDIVQNSHRWYTAASGTAGNLISFTQAMTLDANGDLGVGTTNPTSYSSKTIQLNGSSTSAAIKLTNSTTGEGDGAGFDLELNGSDINYVNRTASGVQKFWTNATERARITSGGMFGLGTTTPNKDGGSAITLTINSSSGGRLELAQSETRYAQMYAGSSGAYITAYTAIPLIFEVNGSERARIDSSGNLLVGGTSRNSALVTASTTGGSKDGFENIMAGNGSANIVTTRTSASGTNNVLYNVVNGSYAGGLTTTTTTFALVASSDFRLKQNIKDLDSQLDVLSQIKVREFQFIAEPDKNVKGFIAQELNAVVPEAVNVGIDNEDGSIKQPWAINQTALIPILTKAIQEQQAIITDLRARVAQLEAK